jgi:hypothetical protein
VLLTGLASFGAVGCVFAAVRRVQRLRLGPSSSAERLCQQLRRAPRHERLALAIANAADGSWEHRLARALADAPNEFERVDAVNVLVDELGVSLASSALWGRGATRTALLLAALMGALGLATARLVDGGVAAAIAMTGAGACHFLALRADPLEPRQRKLADELVRLFIDTPPPH